MCIFCNIPKDSYLYQTDKTFVILDKFPLSKGHLLLIPKTHFPNFHSTPLEYLEDLMSVALYLVKKLNLEKYNLLQNNNHLQSVHHLHFHLIPYDGRGLQINWDTLDLKNYEEEIEKIKLKLKT
ncbi:Hit family protein 1 [Nosema granulosis]|uniref:Hit family protein 1 n=1 Tax=Nosema granulosis TaxID=83296 RepID=A0A9P6KYA7_9MICR|nr:Hit family protein 1 [Nosema granulosis]